MSVSHPELYEPDGPLEMFTALFVPEGGTDVWHQGVHAQHRLEGLLFDLPLCWAADGKQRGATPEEWEVSYDHEALPAVWVVPVPEHADKVTCRDCREWMHA